MSDIDDAPEAELTPTTGPEDEQEDIAAEDSAEDEADPEEQDAEEEEAETEE